MASNSPLSYGYNPLQCVFDAHLQLTPLNMDGLCELALIVEEHGSSNMMGVLILGLKGPCSICFSL